MRERKNAKNDRHDEQDVGKEETQQRHHGRPPARARRPPARPLARRFTWQERDPLPFQARPLNHISALTDGPPPHCTTPNFPRPRYFWQRPCKGECYVLHGVSVPPGTTGRQRRLSCRALGNVACAVGYCGGRCVGKCRRGGRLCWEDLKCGSVALFGAREDCECIVLR